MSEKKRVDVERWWHELYHKWSELELAKALRSLDELPSMIIDMGYLGMKETLGKTRQTIHIIKANCDNPEFPLIEAEAMVARDLSALSVMIANEKNKILSW